MEDNKLNYEEFYDEVWDLISEKTVSDRYMEKNIELIRAVTHDLHRLYDKSDKITIRIASKLLESFFFNLQLFGTNCDDVQDDVSEAYNSFYE